MHLSLTIDSYHFKKKLISLDFRTLIILKSKRVYWAFVQINENFENTK